jgi:hypothetical protein
MSEDAATARGDALTNYSAAVELEHSDLSDPASTIERTE